MKPGNAFQRRFVARLDRPWDLGQLFDYLPDTYFYAKNLRGQFVMVNRALATMSGGCEPDEMIGKTDYDFSPRDMADQYVAEDHRVIETRKPVTRQAWLIADHRGALKWYLSSKIPLFNRAGKVIGIAGAMRDVEKASDLFGALPGNGDRRDAPAHPLCGEDRLSPVGPSGAAVDQSA